MYRCNQLRTTWIIDFHRLKPVKLPIKKIRKVLRQKSAPPLRLLRGSGQKAQALHSSPAPRALSGPRAGRDAWRNWSRPAVTLNPPPFQASAARDLRRGPAAAVGKQACWRFISFSQPTAASAPHGRLARGPGQLSCAQARAGNPARGQARKL